MSCNTNMHSDHIHLVWPLPTFVLHLFFSFFLFFFEEMIKLNKTLVAGLLNAPLHENAGNGKIAGTWGADMGA